MNEVSSNKKDSVLKSLAVVGFIGIIILIAWLSVKLVHVVPGAFSSLASLAESINTSETTDDVEPLLVTSNTTLVNVGETVELTWETADTPGSYTFSYQCTEGVAVDIIKEEGSQSITCDANYNIGDINTLKLVVNSEKNRYDDFNYSISFLATNDTKPRASGNATITVINSSIQNLLAEDETVVEEEATTTEPVVDTENTEVDTPVKTKPTVTPVFEQQYIYEIPTSDPNGRTDLATRFLNIGRIVGNIFFTEAVRQNETGAIQFEVKNYGTKTSANWTFSIKLPNGNTYNSSVQKPLKPNERAVLTIGFPATNDPSHTFVVIVDEPTDKTTLNDSFSQLVTFVR